MFLLKENWSEDQKKAVWNKYAGAGAKYAHDVAGAWMCYDKYGDTSSETNEGWEIDHIVPKSMGGTDDISNLQPLQWYNNRAKSDNYPDFIYEITADGYYNVKRKQYFRIA